MIDRRRALLVTLTAASALAGGARYNGDPDPAALAAYTAQDAHAAAAFDAPDYVGVYHGSANTVGPAADEAAMKAQMAAAKVDWTLGDGKVTVAKAGDLAVFEAPYTFTIAVPNAPTTSEHGNWIAIFRRQGDGLMKLWRSIASDGPTPKPAAG